MTWRERLLRTFRREKTDGVPVAPFLYFNSACEIFKYKPWIDNFLMWMTLTHPEIHRVLRVLRI